MMTLGLLLITICVALFNNHSTPMHSFNSRCMRRCPLINCLIRTIFFFFFFFFLQLPLHSVSCMERKVSKGLDFPLKKKKKLWVMLAMKKPREFRKIRIRMRHWLKIPDFRVLLTDLTINTKLSPMFAASSGKKKKSFIFASCYTDALSVPSVCLEERKKTETP